MSAGRVLVLFVFYVAAIDLALGWGFIGAVASPAGLALLVVAGVMFAWSAFRAVFPFALSVGPRSGSDAPSPFALSVGPRSGPDVRSPFALSVGPRSGPESKGASAALRVARVLLRAGAALTMIALPASLVLRDTRNVSVGEGEAFPAEGGMPAVRFGDVTLAPRGPHLLSKTVEIEAATEGDEPAGIGLFRQHRSRDAAGRCSGSATRRGSLSLARQARRSRKAT